MEDAAQAQAAPYVLAIGLLELGMTAAPMTSATAHAQARIVTTRNTAVPVPGVQILEAHQERVCAVRRAAAGLRTATVMIKGIPT